MNRKIWLALALGTAAALMATGAAYWWGPPQRAAPHAITAAVPAAAAGLLDAAPEKAAQAAPVVPEPEGQATLPPTDTPLRLVVDDLRERAAAGEAAASCRLAAEYLHCAQLPEGRAAMDRWLARQQRQLASSGERAGTEASLAAIEQQMEARQRFLDDLASHCQGVPVPAAAEVARLWRASALGGNPAAMKQYASGNAFRWTQMLDTLPELAAYRRQAEDIATVAAGRGDFDLLLALAAGYAANPGAPRPMLAQTLAPDGARALALYRHVDAALRAHGSHERRVGTQVRERIQGLEQTLAPGELARAARIADTEISRWRSPTMRGVESLDASGRVRDIHRAWCAR